MTTSLGAIYNRLNVMQRNVLIRHIDRELPYIAGKSQVVRALLERGLLKPASPGGGTIRATTLTALGREVVARILAEYAEVLIASGFDISPLGRLRGGNFPSNVKLLEPAATEQVTDIAIIGPKGATP